MYHERLQLLSAVVPVYTTGRYTCTAAVVVHHVQRVLQVNTDIKHDSSTSSRTRHTHTRGYKHGDKKQKHKNKHKKRGKKKQSTIPSFLRGLTKSKFGSTEQSHRYATTLTPVKVNKQTPDQSAAVGKKRR